VATSPVHLTQVASPEVVEFEFAGLGVVITT
jgi:hypothetical protein